MVRPIMLKVIMPASISAKSIVDPALNIQYPSPTCAPSISAATNSVNAILVLVLNPCMIVGRLYGIIILRIISLSLYLKDVASTINCVGVRCTAEYAVIILGKKLPMNIDA